MNEQAVAPTTDRHLTITRNLAAPRELVFEAWIDPDQVAQWWAPEGFHVPRESVEVEARVGGRLHFTMVDGRSGAEYPVHFEIAEMSKPELLVLTSPAVPDLGIMEPTVTRAVFEADGDTTRLTVTQGPHDDVMLRNADLGWRSSLDKLAALLEP
jgi:uncharacterized protein YndB with AHSA1/START domain